MLIALAAFSTLDGFALIAYSWEQETMYYARLLALPSTGAFLLASIVLMRESGSLFAIGPLRTMQLSLVLLLLSLLLMCFAQWHTYLLLLALVLCGGAGLGVLPALRLLSTQVAHDQQAAATATVLAVAHGARAFGLALHAYVFEEATAHGTLNATFVLGLVAAFVALLVAVAIPPSPTAWRLSSAGSSGADVRDRDA